MNHFRVLLNEGHWPELKNSDCHPPQAQCLETAKRHGFVLLEGFLNGVEQVIADK